MDANATSGHVETDGAWLDRKDGRVRIRKLAVGELANNVYVVSCTSTGTSLVIDAAARPEVIRDALADTSPLAIVQTHGHWDHIRAIEALRDDPGLPFWAHDGDHSNYPLPPDRFLTDGDVIDIGVLEVTVIHVPGHTPGSLLFLTRGDTRHHLFSGDTLFPGGHGKTTTAEDHARIMDGLESRVFARLDDETMVYPGHGDDTTIGAERPHLRAWRARGW
ncbi:MAG: MBL fold metallo-hydrolase [Nitriliruptoraceae bacterium]